MPKIVLSGILNAQQRLKTNSTNMKLLIKLASLILFFALFGCDEKAQQKEETVKILQPKEIPDTEGTFYDNQLPTQVFELRADEASVLEGNKGTLVIVPEGAFLDEQGNVYDGSVEIVLKEALQASDMVLANLTTTTEDGQLLSSGGMLFLEAKGDGKKLTINPDNPLYVEIPTEDIKAGMKLYDGERDEQGNIVWKNPKPLQNWLIPIDISTLDFLPDGFDKAVQAGMPFRGHDEATEELVDSLYYSLEPVVIRDYHGEYHTSSLDSQVKQNIFHFAQDSASVQPYDVYPPKTGVHPSAIKALSNKQFNNTFVATKEFEKRLQIIFKTCETEILEVYLKNLNKNLWEADSIVAAKIGRGNYLYDDFKAFADEKKTNVPGVNEKAAQALAKYYDKQLNKNKKELQKKKKAYQKALKKADDKAEKLKQEYAKSLTKRAVYRFEKYGFEIRSGGWKNVDKVIIEVVKDLPKFELNFKVTNGADFDRVHSYTWNPRIKSLWALTSSDKVDFNKSFQKDPVLLMYKDEPSKAVAVGFKEDKIYFSIQEFKQEDVVNINLTLQEISKEDLKKKLNKLEREAKSFNQIQKDLEYQEAFYKEYLRKKQIKHEREFLRSLEEVAFPCCTEELDYMFYGPGKELFAQHCASCHSFGSKSTGPDLDGITRKRDFEWLEAFIRNNAALRASGDKLATKVFRENGGKIMSAFDWLSEQEMRDLLLYLHFHKCYPETYDSQYINEFEEGL